jgi:protein SCO1/2
VRKTRLSASIRRALRKTVFAAPGVLAVALPPGANAATGLLPPPGSYTLDHIQRVPAGIVLEGTRFPRALSRYTTGAITLFSFFYSYCADPNGCPLAWDTFEKMREEIIVRPELHGGVRLVFMSLDPAHDTPEMLRGFARRFEASAAIVPWHFLTTYSISFLNPVLRDMGEEISIDREASGTGGVVINHLPKVFLIDKQGFVREIYSNQSLDPAMILGDIKTLLLE